MYQDKLTAGTVVAERESEIVREMRQLRSASQETQALTETLTKRLAPIIAPMPPADASDKPSSPLTPHATNLREIADSITEANNTLSFILRGLQL